MCQNTREAHVVPLSSIAFSQKRTSNVLVASCGRSGYSTSMRILGVVLGQRTMHIILTGPKTSWGFSRLLFFTPGLYPRMSFSLTSIEDSNRLNIRITFRQRGNWQVTEMTGFSNITVYRWRRSFFLGGRGGVGGAVKRWADPPVFCASDIADLVCVGEIHLACGVASSRSAPPSMKVHTENIFIFSRS